MKGSRGRRVGYVCAGVFPAVEDEHETTDRRDFSRLEDNVAFHYAMISEQLESLKSFVMIFVTIVVFGLLIWAFDLFPDVDFAISDFKLPEFKPLDFPLAPLPAYNPYLPSGGRVFRLDAMQFGAKSLQRPFGQYQGVLV